MHWEVKCVGIEKGVKRKGLQKGRMSEWEYFKDKVKVNIYEVNTGWSCEAIIDHENLASMRWSDEINWTGILRHMMWTKMFDRSGHLWAGHMIYAVIQWSVSNIHVRWTFEWIPSSGDESNEVGNMNEVDYEVDSCGQWTSLYIWGGLKSWTYQWASIFEVDNMRLTLVGRYGRGSILR